MYLADTVYFAQKPIYPPNDGGLFVSSGPRARDRELFEVLLDTEVVAAAPLEKAQREALTTGRPLWRILFRDGLCKEDDLFQILNQSVRAPVLAEDQLKSVVVP